MHSNAEIPESRQSASLMFELFQAADLGVQISSSETGFEISRPVHSDLWDVSVGTGPILAGTYRVTYVARCQPTQVFALTVVDFTDFSPKTRDPVYVRMGEESATLVFEFAIPDGCQGRLLWSLGGEAGKAAIHQISVDRLDRDPWIFEVGPDGSVQQQASSEEPTSCRFHLADPVVALWEARLRCANLPAGRRCRVTARLRSDRPRQVVAAIAERGDLERRWQPEISWCIDASWRDLVLETEIPADAEGEFILLLGGESPSVDLASVHVEELDRPVLFLVHDNDVSAQLVRRSADEDSIGVEVNGSINDIWSVRLCQGPFAGRGLFRWMSTATGGPTFAMAVRTLSDESAVIHWSGEVEPAQAGYLHRGEFDARDHAMFQLEWCLGVGVREATIALGGLERVAAPLVRLEVQPAIQASLQSSMSLPAAIRFEQTPPRHNPEESTLVIGPISGANSVRMDLRFSLESSADLLVCAQGLRSRRLLGPVNSLRGKEGFQSVVYECSMAQDEEAAFRVLLGGLQGIGWIEEVVCSMMSRPPFLLDSIRSQTWLSPPAESSGNGIRIEIARTMGNPLEVVLRQSVGRWELGSQVRLTFQARSDHPRSATVGLRQSQVPWARLGLREMLELTPLWQSFSFTFAVSRTDDAEVYFSLGHEATAVEVDDMCLARVDGSI